MPLPSNWRNFCQFDGKFVKVTWNWLIFCTFSVKISLQLCQFSKQCRNTIARSFLGMHWNCQSLGTQFVHPSGLRPLGWKIVVPWDLQFQCIPQNDRAIGAGTKIEFLTDQGETLRNEYLLCKNFKTGFGFFVTRTVFSHQLCPRSPRTGSATGCVGRVGD